ncbi:MAG: (5-formylfuran-3-yl)methyl phosphate synthase [Candidatus Methylumidiphilus sp.]
MTGMLASVENLAEALLVLDIGVDIIDLKSPSAGSLGALPVETVGNIVQAVAGRLPISATIGDLSMNPPSVFDAVAAMAGAGVDYVKIGFFPGGDWQRTVAGLTPLALRGVRLVAVLFGDRQPELDHIAELDQAGFSAVMLDTMDKRTGSLTQVCDMDFLRSFVQETKACGMICGLAGSLTMNDIPKLLPLRPDYLGFRGALCKKHDRTASLDETAVISIRQFLLK